MNFVGARYPLSVLLAIAVNALLFLFVIHMVGGGRPAHKLQDDISQIEFIRLERAPEPLSVTRPQKLPDRPPPKEPPPPPQSAAQKLAPPTAPALQVPQPALSDIPLQITGVPQIGAAGVPAVPVEQPAAAIAPATGAPEIDVTAVPTYRSPPLYPPRAQRAGIEGSVTVEFTITTDGGVKDPRVVTADPPEVFNEAVLNAILKWKFNPKVVDGRPVERRARQVVIFTLRGR